MSKYCPITLEETSDKYSRSALKKFSSKLMDIEDLPLSAGELREEAAHRAARMSIQGVQAKLSARFKVKEGKFEIVDKNGTYILKPQSQLYSELPENEALTMSMAKIAGIDVPFHGLLYSSDSSFTYFIKRFDRYAKNKKYALEDFAQLSGKSRETKYASSYERVVQVIDKFCSFPMIEKKKFYLRFLFCYLTGNEDMHLKNFSLITRDSKIELSPAYDLLNSTIAMKDPQHEVALPLKGQTKKLSRKLLTDYLPKEKLMLSEKVYGDVIDDLLDKKEDFKTLISRSMLSDEMQLKYLDLLEQRFKNLSSQ
jgi:serine/threonine-protein kinase HipA